METRLNELGQPIGDAVENWGPAQSPSRQAMVGTYCRVEPIDLERHAAELFEAFEKDQENRIWTYLPCGPFTGVARFRDWMAGACFGDDPLFHTIIDTATNRAVGFASFLRIEPAVGVIEVGFINYSPELQRTPAATEVMYLMMRRVFSELGYRRYEWKCDALNEPSRRAAERLGFRFEGIFRQATMYKGRNRDTAWYSILDCEWPTLDQAFSAWLSSDNFDSTGQQKTSLGNQITHHRR
jgi:RimJ/RimL family protein N-acetyltransferase